MTTKKKPKVKATTSTPIWASTPAHHFFVTSLGEWRTGYDLGELIAYMKLDSLPFNVYMVPGPEDTPYEIQCFRPMVEGVVWLAFYDRDQT